MTYGGQVWLLAAQAGYQLLSGRRVATAFARIETDYQAIMPFDPGDTVQGRKIGLTMTLETGTNIADRWFVSAGAS
jgi:hypothetical protein